MSSPASPQPEAESRRYARRAAAAAAITRVAVFVVAVAGAYLAHQYGHSASAFLHDLVVAPWTRKDAGWFVRIAQEGYGPVTARAAFFPLYPLVIRAASLLTGGSFWVAGMVVSLACYAGAMVLLFRLTAAQVGARVAAGTVILISVFPTAFVFSAAYSESLFLLLTVAAFALAQGRRWPLACAAAALATLTRSSGVVLLAPLLLIYAEQAGWTIRGRGLKWPRDLRVAWLLLVPAAVGAYMTFLWVRFGDALLFAKVQRVTWHRSLDWPWVDVWRGARAASRGVRFSVLHLAQLPDGLLPGHRYQVVTTRTLLPFLALLFAVALLVVVVRRLPAPYAVYSALALLVPLLEPSANVPLYSFHRFVLVVFPLFMGLALVLAKRRVLFWVVAALSFALMLYLTVCFTSASTAAHGVV